MTYDWLDWFRDVLLIACFGLAVLGGILYCLGRAFEALRELIRLFKQP